MLNHDNTDIAIDVVTLIQDLTDENVLDENDEPAKVLVDALVDSSALEPLVQNLHRLSEKDADENAAVYNTLAKIENLIEVKPTVAEMVCEKTMFFENQRSLFFFLFLGIFTKSEKRV